MNKIKLSNFLFHSFDWQESSFLKALDGLRSQPLSVSSMQSLRKFSRKVSSLFTLFNEGRNDIVNRYGEDHLDESGNSTGKRLLQGNSEGMKAYNELCQLTNEVSVEIIDLAKEEALTWKPIIMSEKDYESLVFLFEEMPVIENPEASKE